LGLGRTFSGYFVVVIDDPVVNSCVKSDIEVELHSYTNIQQQIPSPFA